MDVIQNSVHSLEFEMSLEFDKRIGAPPLQSRAERVSVPCCAVAVPG